MAAILYDFPGVPGDADPRVRNPANPPWADVRYLGIYQDLKERGLLLPADPAGTIERPALVAHLQELLGELVRAELESDPEDLYEDGAGDEEHAAAFCAHRPHEKDPNIEIPSRLSQVLARFPYGPNVLSAEDIEAARR